MECRMSSRTPLPPLAVMLDACRRERALTLREVGRTPELRELRWKVDREPRLLAIDSEGNRLDESSWVVWKRRKKEVAMLYERFPEAVKIIVDSGINLYERAGDADYEPVFWQAVIWQDFAQVDALVRANTAFRSLEDILAAEGGYRPSLDVREPAMKAIADAYDQLAEMRGDPRRAYRYGT